jgi:hypothetical protein
VAPTTGPKIAPASRYVMGTTLTAAGLIYAWVPGAASARGMFQIERWGGHRLWFMALALTAAAQVIAWRQQQLHLHLFCLWAETFVLAGLAAALAAAAVRLGTAGQGWAGLGGSVIWLGLAVSHAANVPEAIRLYRL